MSLKLLLFIGLMVVTTIEANRFFKKIHDKSLSSLELKLPHKVSNHIRRRRDAEAVETLSIDETSSAGELLKFFMAVAWEESKLETLAGFIEEMSDKDTNLTVIGWQRVLDGEGKIAELRTIQLVIPPKPLDLYAPHNIVDDDDDDDDDEDDFTLPHDDIKEMKEMFGPMEELGIPGCITYETFDSDGDLDGLIYLDNNQVYANADDFSIYNKTEVADAQHVKDFITNLKPGILGKPSVLKYDVDCHLIPDQSNIKPQYLGYVAEDHEATDTMLAEAPQIVAEVAYQYPRDEAAKQLALRYNKKYPEYKWRVILDPENYYVTRDVTLLLSYDNFDFDEDSNISFLVIGNKKVKT